MSAFSFSIGDMDLPLGERVRIWSNGSQRIDDTIPDGHVRVERRIWSAPRGPDGWWEKGVWIEQTSPPYVLDETGRVRTDADGRALFTRRIPGQRERVVATWDDLEHVNDTWSMSTKTYESGGFLDRVRAALTPCDAHPSPGDGRRHDGESKDCRCGTAAAFDFVESPEVDPPRQEPLGNHKPIYRCLVDGASWADIDPTNTYPHNNRRFRPIDVGKVRMKIGTTLIDIRDVEVVAPEDLDDTL